MLLPLFDRLQSRPAMALRLVGLCGLIYWQFRASDAPGLHGRGLVILITLIGAVISWIPWSLANRDFSILQVGLSWDVFLMATCGAVMVAASPSGASNVFMFAAAFTAGVRVGMPRAFLVTVVAIVGVAVGWVIFESGSIGAVAYSLGLVATTFGGAQRHDALQRREQAELLLAQTQRSHEEALRNAKLEESSRIAREIHDVLAHSLAGLTIQLEATAALIEGGADAPSVLPRIQRAYELAREGLRETRLAVGALRGDETPLVPAASRIEAIVGDLRASGSEITLDLDGGREQLTGPVGDAAVRIIQEALTNVVKHAPGARVTVSVTAGPPISLTVQSRDDAGARARTSLAATGGGYGIAGMRERAEELGGSLAAGATPDGWLVSAVLGGSES